MRRLTRQPQLRLITELSITPLITVVLILLFVFILAGPLLRETTSVPAPAARGSTPASTARLVLDKSGTIVLEGRPVLLASLKGQLTALVKDKPGTGVVVQMDKDLPVQVLVDLMDVLRQAGVQKTAVTTLEK